MIIKRLFVWAALLVLAAAFLGCGSDDNPTGTVLTGDAGAAQAMINNVIIPSIEGVNLAKYASLIGAPAASPGVDACEPLDLCDSGSAEMCADQTGVQLNFTDCVSHNTTVDGTVTFQGGPTSGSALLDITLNGNPVVGQISYSSDGTCFTQTFSGVSVSVGDYSAVVYGDLIFCNPPETINGVIIPTEGNLTFTLFAEQRAIEFWFYPGDRPGAWSLYVWDLAFSEQFLFCTGYLYDEFECGPPPEDQ